MKVCSSHPLLVAVTAAGAVLAGSQSHPNGTGGPVARLGYATFEGYHDPLYGLDVWKGVPYALPPIGALRWQAPQAPRGNASEKILAVTQPPLCPQTGAYGVPELYGFNSALGNEDCLFLNVYAASNATELPVLIWIHGGGYGDFGALYDPSVLINTNNNGFIVVEIQYRLGAFGFLASEDVRLHGKLNAGLLDQRFALQWVQKHISKFGGDPNRVTIGGESSGAGSVMFHTLAYGGDEEDVLFSNVVAASPYSPAIHAYNDSVPTSYYDTFAELTGCGRNTSQRTQYSSVFECLVAADTEALQYASGKVSESYGYFGSWAFLPVIDGDFITTRPSLQLSQNKVSGKRILVGNNANEGVPLTNPDVVSRADYDAFVAATFPLFTPADTVQLNIVYRINESALGDNSTRFDTLGDTGPTALTQSEMATGIQQSVFNMQAETTFACPAQWLAEAFSSEGSSGRQAWKYQFSVTPAYHGADLSAYFAVGATVPNADFRHAFQKIWGNFIIHNTPVISLVDATAGYSNATVPAGLDGEIQWPLYDADGPWQMDLNTTGGIVTETVVTTDLKYFERTGDGIVNVFRLVNASSWEGERGARCDFWRSISARVPQ